MAVAEYLECKRICDMVDVRTYERTTHNEIVPLYTLVWGSLRLAPITCFCFVFFIAYGPPWPKAQIKITNSTSPTVWLGNEANTQNKKMLEFSLSKKKVRSKDKEKQSE